jgi:hypothetical protein
LFDLITSKDIGPILNAWLIPVLVIVSQLDVSPAEKWSLFHHLVAVLHLVGDPIDSILCLLIYAEKWNRCRRIAKKKWSEGQQSRRDSGVAVNQVNDHPPARRRRSVVDVTYGTLDGRQTDFERIYATYLGCITECIDSSIDPTVIDRIIISAVIQWEEQDMARFRIHVAHDIADLRSSELNKTIFTVILYLWQVLGAFNAHIGGSPSSPPGGRIAIALFMTFVFPAVLFSNTIGGYPSSRTCYRILQQHLPDNIELLHILRPNINQPNNLNRDNAMQAYLESRPASGAIYTYNASKELFSSRCTLPWYWGGDRPISVLLILAYAPVFTSTVTSLVVMWHLPPPSPNCRWFVLLGISVVYIASAGFTAYSYHLILSFSPRAKPQSHLLLTLVKSAIIAIAALLLLFLSSAGLFNTCLCWSGYLKLGRLGARIPIVADISFRPYIKRLYPALFYGCLVLQMVIFGFMIVISWDGIKTMRWSERERRRGLYDPGVRAWRRVWSRCMSFLNRFYGFMNQIVDWCKEVLVHCGQRVQAAWRRIQ